MKKQNTVLMYSKDPCPFCVAAKRFFNEHNIEFNEIDLTHNTDELLKIKKETGWMTVPIILINNNVIGGYTDLKALYEKNELDTYLFQTK